MKVRVIALGSELGGDDQAALLVARELSFAPELALARELAGEAVEVILAGRPGPDLLEHFEDGVALVLLDVVRRGLGPGVVVTLPLDELGTRGLSSGAMGSHDLGPVDALRLGEALGRPRPVGLFVGLGGARFSPGPELSDEVASAMPSFASAARSAIARMKEKEQKSDA